MFGARFSVLLQELAPYQHASGSLHDEAWAGLVGCSSVRIPLK